VNIQNYQGIEIIGIESPVYITRFDVANLDFCYNPSNSYRRKYRRRFFFGKIPPKSEQNCSIDYDQAIKYDDKSSKSRWYCTAQIYLFCPEPRDAPHMLYQVDIRSFDEDRIPHEKKLFDINLDFFETFKCMKNVWGKIKYIYCQ